MTKKITDLLELLRKNSYVYSVKSWFGSSGYISAQYQSTSLIMEDYSYTFKGHEELTSKWNKLTGDNLKDVTWIL